MLSSVSRALTFLCSILYAILGGILFLFPERLAPVFAWKVTPFMTMTIGAWCLGNAWLAWISARRWQWRLVYTALVYLWLFGTLETVILIVFRDKVRLVHPVAWLYVATLLLNVITAIVGFRDLMRIKPSYERFGPPSAAWLRGSALAFVVFVGFLSIYGLVAQIGWPATRGGIFPEEMSLFTLRSFAAFYFSLAVGALPLIREDNLPVILNHSIANYALVILITAAALVYMRLFDFVERPGGLLYFGAYLIVGIPLFFIFSKYGTGLKNE